MLDFLQKDIDISQLWNFKTKAITSYYFEIHNRQDVDKLIDIVHFSKQKWLSILFVSAGTNTLFAFDKYDGIIIKNCLQWWSYDRQTCLLEAYWAEKIWDIALSLKNDYSQDLWHRFIWLPWSIAGAISWNAWCFWLEAESNFLNCEVLDLETWKIEILERKDMNFSYRSSILKNSSRYFLIKVNFDLSEKVEKYSSDIDNIAFRENMQPKWNSCGSFFKNPSKEFSAWTLIEKVWLKWFHLKTAYFSEKHANFLMSLDNWNYRDLLDLIKLAQDKVKDKFDIDLVPEVRIIYNKK